MEHEELYRRQNGASGAQDGSQGGLLADKATVADAPILVKNSELMKNEKALPKIPDHVEWWDEFLLPPDSATKSFPIDIPISDNDIYMERITHYIQHPVPLKNQ